MQEHPEGWNEPAPVGTAPVEPKVKAAAAAGGAAAATGSLIVWLLGEYVFKGSTPLPVEVFVDVVVVGGLASGGAWVAGWFAKHAPRW